MMFRRKKREQLKTPPVVTPPKAVGPHNPDYEFLLKILLIGDSGVGKSCWLLRLADPNYIFSDAHISSIGVDFKVLTLTYAGRVLKLQIWDTAGQERFRTITSSYYRGAHIIAVAYDVSDLVSFHNIAKWLQEVDRYANDSALKLVLALKCDLQAAVDAESAKEICESLNLEMCKCSAKTGVGREETLNTICRIFLAARDDDDQPDSVPSSSSSSSSSSLTLTASLKKPKTLSKSTDSGPSKPAFNTPEKTASPERPQGVAEASSPIDSKPGSKIKPPEDGDALRGSSIRRMFRSLRTSKYVDGAATPSAAGSASNLTLSSIDASPQQSRPKLSDANSSTDSEKKMFHARRQKILNFPMPDDLPSSSSSLLNLRKHSKLAGSFELSSSNFLPDGIAPVVRSPSPLSSQPPSNSPHPIISLTPPPPPPPSPLSTVSSSFSTPVAPPASSVPGVEATQSGHSSNIESDALDCGYLPDPTENDPHVTFNPTAVTISILPVAQPTTPVAGPIPSAQLDPPQGGFASYTTPQRQGRDGEDECSDVSSEDDDDLSGREIGALTISLPKTGNYTEHIDRAPLSQGYQLCSPAYNNDPSTLDFHQPADQTPLIDIPDPVKIHIFFDPKSPQPLPSEEAMNMGDFELNEAFQTSFHAFRNDIEQDVRSIAFRTINDQLYDTTLNFLSSAEAYGRIIIAERYLPLERKQIKPTLLGGVAGGEKYLVHGILFKFAVDFNGMYGGRDNLAIKVAGHELKGLTMYQRCITPLCLPLMALVDYMGFRIVAMSRLPISGRKTLMYGSDDAGLSVQLDPTFTALMHDISNELNLHEHMTSKGLYIPSATDIEGHLGADGRRYLLDFARTMPPTRPSRAHHMGHLYQLFRPEFVCKYPRRLCPDSFSSFLLPDPQRAQLNQDAVEATKCLFETTIPKSMKRIVAEAAAACDELADPSQLSFSLAEELHKDGINLRYLGYMYLAAVQTPSLAEYPRRVFTLLLIAEAVARICKNELRNLLRIRLAHLRLSQASAYQDCVIRFLNLAFGVDCLESAELWYALIEPHLQIHFGLRVAELKEDPSLRSLWAPEATFRSFMLRCTFPISNRPGSNASMVYLILRRLSEMSGLVFRQGYLQSILHMPLSTLAFSCHRMDLHSIVPRIKSSNLISLTRGNLLFAEGLQGYYGKDTCVELMAQALECFSAGLRSSPTDHRLLFQSAEVLCRQIKLEHGSTLVDAHKPHLTRIDTWFLRAFDYWPINDVPGRAHCLAAYAAFLEFSRRLIRAEEKYLSSLEINPLRPSTLKQYAGFLEHLQEQGMGSYPEANELRARAIRLETLNQQFNNERRI